eukprot:scaffold625_cov324-Pavlova_lutheri.AAC.106
MSPSLSKMNPEPLLRPTSAPPKAVMDTVKFTTAGAHASAASVMKCGPRQAFRIDQADGSCSFVGSASAKGASERAYAAPAYAHPPPNAASAIARPRSDRMARISTSSSGFRRRSTPRTGQASVASHVSPVFVGIGSHGGETQTSSRGRRTAHERARRTKNASFASFIVES